MFLGGTWKALGFLHRLPDQNKPIFNSFEEKCVVSERHKEIVTKCSIFDAKSLLRNVIDRRMLKIKFVGQEIILCRLADLVASQCLNFILDLFVFFYSFRIEAISPLSGGDSEELFSCVVYLLVVYLYIYV